ncbi:hypothetical protein Y032_0114g439 [Ancylostoma ceylanicum]|uniref:G-protein coupled receptors family 1 profile domain-containing protein n=1 Tax=Ancylostoma ceylanicum TaxID=53326 RepID=A0A016TDD4_9BILA|nr:hypothetical protein Y032_0114g439 [Ancylostoma ceylanicum]
MTSSSEGDGLCSQSSALVFGAFTVASYMVSSSMLIAACALVLMSRKVFHVFFSALFTLALAFYVVCNALNVASSILLFLDHYSPTLYKALDIAYQGAYVYTTCNIFSTTLSRITGSGASDLILFILAILIIASLTILLLINRKLILSFRGGRRSLSTRYQLTENVRALRLAVPVVVLDTLVTSADLIASNFFDIAVEFEPKKCSTHAHYLLFYIVFRLASVAFELCIPVAIVRHESLSKVLSAYCHKREVHLGKEKRAVTITNVLGMNIQGGNDDHFGQLRQQWS